MSIEIILLSFANIKTGEKYYISENKSYSQNSLSFFYRKFYNEDRYKTLEYISNILSIYNLTNEKLYLNALNGIENLVQTYADDSEMKYRLETIISEAKLRIDNLYFDEEEKELIIEERKDVAENPPEWLLGEKKELVDPEGEIKYLLDHLLKYPSNTSISETFISNLLKSHRF